MDNLEIQVDKTNVGPYTVAWNYIKAPSDVQERAFADKGLDTISPAQLGFLQANESKGTFNQGSRTSADVLYGYKRKQLVIVPDRAIIKRVGIAKLVHAHSQEREYVIPKNKRGPIYALVDEMLENGTAFTADHDQLDVMTSKFGQEELTSKLFSDEKLGIKAQGYGDWLNSQGIIALAFLFDGTGDYVESQKGPYVKMLRVFFGRDDNNHFAVSSGKKDLDFEGIGAFGTRFEKTAEVGTKK